MAVTQEKKTAHRVFTALVKYLRNACFEFKEIAKECGVSEQTLRQYCANPETTAFRVPTVEAIDELIGEATKLQNIDVRNPKYRAVIGGSDWMRCEFATAIGAQDFIDQFSLTTMKADIEVIGGGELPDLTEDEHLRMRWRWAVKGKVLPRHVLAHIAGVSDYEVGLVGRELSFGIQPTREQVEAAEAARRSAKTLARLMTLRRDAA